MKNAKRTVVVIALIALMAIPAMFAYFTDSDSVTNTFTVGNVEIDLVEKDAEGTIVGGDGESTTGINVENLVPGQVIAKKPNVKNTSTTNAAYVFVKVTVPKVGDNVLFSYANKAGWVPVEDATVNTDTVKVFAYAADGKMTAVPASDETTALFDTVQFNKNVVETIDGVQNIKIDAYAVQTDLDGAVDGDTVTETWEVVKAKFF